MNLSNMRKPLAPGNIYIDPEDPNHKFQVTNMALPGTHFDDNGAPGVAVKWIGFHRGVRQNGWYICQSESDFWTIWSVKCFISPIYLPMWQEQKQAEEITAQMGAGI